MRQKQENVGKSLGWNRINAIFWRTTKRFTSVTPSHHPSWSFCGKSNKHNLSHFGKNVFAYDINLQLVNHVPWDFIKGMRASIPPTHGHRSSMTVGQMFGVSYSNLKLVVESTFAWKIWRLFLCQIPYLTQPELEHEASGLLTTELPRPPNT